MKAIERREHEDVTYWKLGFDLFGKPKMYVYIFLIDGLLIDTGMVWLSNEINDALASESVDKIILTHHHEDHTGNVESIKKAKGVSAYGSHKCCELMKSPAKVEPARWITWGQNKPATILALDIKATLKTAGHDLRIIETPGHAIDHISLYDADKGWLFSGDIYVHDYINVFMRDEDIGLQVTSIRKLLQLEFDVLFCNHQPILKNGKIRLANKLQFLEDFLGRVTDVYELGMSPKVIMKELDLKENRLIKMMSLGQLSRLNMIKSAMNTIERNIVAINL